MAIAGGMLGGTAVAAGFYMLIGDAQSLGLLIGWASAATSSWAIAIFQIWAQRQFG